MQITTDYATPPEAIDDLVAAAVRAADWAGEPFLHPNEEPARVLAPGTSRRYALDDALAEIARGEREPSFRWRVRFGLMLGLERVLSAEPVRLASGTELRRHQVDALAGMLAELIAMHQAEAPNGNGNGAVAAEELELAEEDDEPEDELGLSDGLDELPRRTGRSTTRARCVASASATRPRRGRPSRPPGSSRPRPRSAS